VIKTKKTVPIRPTEVKQQNDNEGTPVKKRKEKGPKTPRKRQQTKKERRKQKNEEAPKTGKPCKE
jgi:hypothetical protein